MLKRNLARVRASIDGSVAPFARYQHPETGWITAIRSALGMSQAQFALRLGVSRQNVNKMEERERTRSITLGQLHAAAQSLGCDLAYAFVPREPLTDMVTDRAHAVAQSRLLAIARTMQLEDQASEVDVLAREDYIAEHLTERDLWQDPAAELPGTRKAR